MAVTKRKRKKGDKGACDRLDKGRGGDEVITPASSINFGSQLNAEN